MEQKEMKRNMGVLTAMSVVVGCVIGAGVFLNRTQFIRLPAERREWL